MPSIFKLSAVPALAAALSLSITPASAAELLATGTPRSDVEVQSAWSPDDDIAANHRRYRYRRDRDIDAGDVIAGVLIIGGIAAIANAANRGRDDSYRDRDWRYPDSDGAGWRGDDPRGLDRAVRQCVGAIERDSRVETVDSANREGDGWRVTGSLYNGAGFSCSVGADGRIESIEAGGQDFGSDDAGGDYGYSEDRQWNDDRYAEERARIDGQADSEEMAGPQPAYPGGPVEGEEPADGDFEVGEGYDGAD